MDRGACHTRGDHTEAPFYFAEDRPRIPFTVDNGVVPEGRISSQPRVTGIVNDPWKAAAYVFPFSQTFLLKHVILNNLEFRGILLYNLASYFLKMDCFMVNQKLSLCLAFCIKSFVIYFIFRPLNEAVNIC